MQSWSRPALPSLPGQGTVPMLFDTVSQSIRPAEPTDGVAGLYVCGITPYDAAHLGHAATYLAFDTLVRLWLDAGYEVRYAQNVTDVDDPLLERAEQTGVDWRDLAAEQTELFRQDMQALGVIPPDYFIAVTDVIDPIAEAVADLVDRGFGYRVDDDVYFDNAAAEAGAPWRLGEESRLDESTMLELFAERGGDPERTGKRHPLDPLLWRAQRDGEPSWESPVGAGRPGWHIECSVIAQQSLDIPITVNGGGSDLVFPHHEFSAAHTAALTGTPLASLYSHAGMVAYQGEKMSKSLGNLVFVSKLRAAGTDPRAIRLALLTEHYRQDWDWSEQSLTAAEARLVRWVAWAATEPGDDDSLVAELRTLLAHDLDTPAAVAEVDQHVARQTRPSPASLDAIEALLGISLR